MLPDSAHKFSGLLLESPARVVQPADLLRCRGMKFQTNVADSKWEQYQLTSEKPLHSEVVTVERGPYVYPIICRRSGSRVLILSIHRRIVEHLLHAELD